MAFDMANLDLVAHIDWQHVTILLQPFQYLA